MCALRRSSESASGGPSSAIAISATPAYQSACWLRRDLPAAPAQHHDGARVHRDQQDDERDPRGVEREHAPSLTGGSAGAAGQRARTRYAVAVAAAASPMMLPVEPPGGCSSTSAAAISRSRYSLRCMRETTSLWTWAVPSKIW